MPEAEQSAASSSLLRVLHEPPVFSATANKAHVLQRRRLFLRSPGAGSWLRLNPSLPMAPLVNHSRTVAAMAERLLAQTGEDDIACRGGGCRHRLAIQHR